MNESTLLTRARAALFGPLIVFLAIAAAIFAITERKQHERLKQLLQRTADQAAQVAQELQEEVAAQIGLIQQLRDLEAAEAFRDRAGGDALAAALARQLELAAIARLGPDGAPLRLLPESARLPAGDGAAAFFERARAERTDLVTPSLRLKSGGFGFAGYFPVVRGGRVEEVLAAYFRYDDLIENSVDGTTLAQYNIVLRDLDERRLVYERWHDDPERRRSLRRQAELRIAGHRYQVEAMPGAPLIDETWSGLWLERLLGFLLALLLAAAARRLLLRGVELQRRGQLISGLLSGLPLTVFRLGRGGALEEATGRGAEALGLERLLAGRAPGELADAIAAAAAGKPANAEVRIGGASYELSLLPDAGGSGGVVGFAHEVTRHRQAEEALRRSENRYRGFFQDAPFGYLVTSEEGRIELANREAARLLGRGEEQLEGRPLIEILGAGRSGRLAAAALLERVERGEEIRDHELRLTAKDGRTLWCSLSVQPVHEDGEYAGGRCVLLDISRRRELEERLRESGKMEAVGRVAGGISHDFNNLLTAIMGFARLARGRLPPGSPPERDLAEIEKAGKRAVAVVARLLAFSRQQPSEARPVEINARVRDLAAMLRRLVREDIELDLRLGDAGSARIDPAQLEQILVDLVVNGMEAIDGRGHLVIETSTLRRPGEPPQSRIRVIDDGRGMEPEVRAHLFEPFFTTKHALSAEGPVGSGLGLAAVYGIVEQHQGRILVDSEPGLGTTVTVLFPRLPEGEAERPGPRAAAPAAPLPAGGRERVLIVEDEEQVREMAREMLEMLGYRPTAARDGRHALELVAGRESEVDLLLSDVVMPHLGGEALYHALKARHPGLKVVFTSGYTDDPFIRKSVEAGALPFLHKPYTLDSLAAALRDALGRP